MESVVVQVKQRVQREDFKLVNDSAGRFEESSCGTAVNLASSPALSPPKDDDNVVFIIVFQWEGKERVHTRPRADQSPVPGATVLRHQMCASLCTIKSCNVV
jgi:hypothetical protein